MLPNAAAVRADHGSWRGCRGVPPAPLPEAGKRDSNMAGIKFLAWDPSPLGLPEILTVAQMPFSRCSCKSLGVFRPGANLKNCSGGEPVRWYVQSSAAPHTGCATPHQ